MGARGIAIAGCLVLVAVGCKGGGKAVDQGGRGDRVGAEAAALARPAARALPLGEAQVDALVNRWLAAQNRGDFAAYERLYAERMTGIKRVGARALTYDRTGWMRDRKRMFQKKMVVEAAQVRVQASAQSAIVRLEQTWASGRFKDVGAKQLVVVREGQALRIAREEMLASIILGAKNQAPAGAEEIALFVHAGIHGYVVLGNDPQESWAAGELEVVDSGRPFVVRRRLDRAKLSPQLQARHRGGLRYVDADGSRCAAALGEVYGLAGATPHFGTVQMWNGEIEEHSAKASMTERAADIWKMVEPADRMVVAEVVGACRGTLVSFTPLANPRPFAAVKGPEAVTQAALSAVRALPAYQSTQRSFVAEADVDPAGRWEDSGDLHIDVFHDPKSGRYVVAFDAVAGEGCGEWMGLLTALVEVDAAGRATVLAGDSVPSPFRATNVFDFDGDGAIEVIGTGDWGQATMLIAQVGGRFEVLRSASFPFYDCGC